MAGQTGLMHPACRLALAMTVACTPRPSAQLELADPQSKSGPSGDATERRDARLEALCAHSFAVLAGENPSLRSPAIERDFIERCIAGNQAKLSELGEQRWAERARCIEQAKTSEDIGRCDGRTPRPESNPAVSGTGIDGRQICEHVFDIVLTQNPDVANILGPTELAPLIDECAEQAELERVQDPIEFDREARCLMAAKTPEEFERCDED